ncbi:MAG: oligosaccharide flippase family protein [Rhodobacteraceae bacterium]|nr:oligosaccharide flippase family protein [Paracoccaceae bacterium]
MQSLLKSSALSTLAGVLSLVAGFACGVIVARLLGPEGNGGVAFALWLAMTAGTLSDLGLPTLLLRYMPRFDGQGGPGGGLARLVLPRFILAQVVTIFGIYIYITWLKANPQYTVHPLLLVIVSVVLYAVYIWASLGEHAARGLNRFGETARMTFYGCLLQIPLVFIGAYFWGVPGAILGYVSRYLPQAINSIKYAKAKPLETTTLTPDMRSFARNNWVADCIGLLIWTRVEFIFLGLYFSTSDIGHYAAGLTLSSLVVQLPTQMMGALIPHIGKHHDAEEHEQIQIIYATSIRWVFLLILPICIGGAAVAGELIPALFGEEFRAAGPLAAVLIGTAFATALSTVPSVTVDARERSDFLIKVTPVLALFSVGAFWLGSLRGDVMDIAIIRGLVHSVWVLTLLWFCWKHLKLNLNVRDVVKITISAALCGGTAFGVLQLTGGVAGLLLAIAIGALVYLIAVKFLRVIPSADVDTILDNLPEKTPRRLALVIGSSLTFLAGNGPTHSP